MSKLLSVLLLVSKAVFAVTLGTLATMCPLYVMQALIVRGERPPPPDELPPTPELERVLQEGAQAPGYQITTASLNVSQKMEVGGVHYAVTDREYLPLVKVEPAYPVQAAAKNLVGWVIVEYTVTRTGTVRNPVVIANCAIVSPNQPEIPCENHPSSVFNKAAIRAALEFKYTPKTIDDVPIDTEGVRNYFSFRFDQ